MTTPIYLHNREPPLTPTVITQPKYSPPSHSLAKKWIKYFSNIEDMIQHPQTLATMKT